MKVHQQRVIDELEELSERLEKLDERLERLDGFLERTPSGIALAPEERADMQMQSDVMSHYLRILKRRRDRF